MKNLIKLTFMIVISALSFACGDKRVLEPNPSEIKQPLKIGDTHEGGMIFYIDSTGAHGFIAKTSDESVGSGIINIPDNNTQVTSNITVSGVAGNVGTQLLSVGININHPYTSDLDISLRAPNGIIIDLSSDNGGSGDNYTNTFFVNSALPITSVPPPFTGNYAPEQPFSNLSGSVANGTWSLLITDDSGGDAGSLINWSISFTTGTFNYPSTGIKWNNGSNITTNAWGTSKWTGASNTSLIVSMQGPGSYAASICDGLTDGGYSNWHLPSLNELTLLYSQKSIVGNFTSSSYWTSSEISASTAYIVNFSSGSYSSYPKSNFAALRAIRSF